jgi:hypothetical protein
VPRGASPAVVCAICERSLLVGERSERFSPDGIEYVDVCPLCRERALEAGWYREGGPSLHVRPPEQRRGWFAKLFKAPTPPVVDAVAEPILRRLSPEDQVVVQAASLFNGSPHRRTVEGLIRSLGMPRAAIRPTGERTAVVTICWDISWYQYEVDADDVQPVRLAERGFDLTDLEVAQTAWNSDVDMAGRLVPSVAPE